jgi:hypothetical protein
MSHRSRNRPARVERYGPGEEATAAQYAPGDFILTHSNNVFARLIRFGESLRYWGSDRAFARWNHAALIVSEQGELIEALSRGVVQTHISRYRPTEYYVVRLNPDDADPREREHAVAYAMFCLGDPYGWVTIASIALALLTGCKFTFGVEGRVICSGLVARSLERTAIIFEGDAANVSPADLARQFEVVPPAAGTPIGEPPD